MYGRMSESTASGRYNGIVLNNLTDFQFDIVSNSGLNVGNEPRDGALEGALNVSPHLSKIKSRDTSKYSTGMHSPRGSPGTPTSRHFLQPATTPQKPSFNTPPLMKNAHTNITPNKRASPASSYNSSPSTMPYRSPLLNNSHLSGLPIRGSKSSTSTPHSFSNFSVQSPRTFTPQKNKKIAPPFLTSPKLISSPQKMNSSTYQQQSPYEKRKKEIEDGMLGIWDAIKKGKFFLIQEEFDFDFVTKRKIPFDRIEQKIKFTNPYSAVLVSPIHVAAYYGELNVVQFLHNQKEGDLFEATSCGKMAPIHFAAYCGSPKLVEYFLDKGENVNRPCDAYILNGMIREEGTTLLHIAALSGNIGLIKFLIKRGCRIDSLTNNGKHNALHFAVLSQNPDVVRYLVEYVPFFKSYQYLIDCGGDDSSDDGTSPQEETISPLHFAVLNNNFEVVKYLVQQGCKLNERMNGFTPLHLAIKVGSHEVAKYLIHIGADITINAISQESKMQQSCLHLAILENDLDMCKILVDAGAKVDQGCGGKTPIEVASECGFLSIIEYLIQCCNDNLTLDHHGKKRNLENHKKKLTEAKALYEAWLKQNDDGDYDSDYDE